MHDCVIVGSGPGGLGAAYALLDRKPSPKILIIEKQTVSSGGLRNDCKMNFSYPIGFPQDLWGRAEAERCLAVMQPILKPEIMPKRNLAVYSERAQRLGVDLLHIEQAHLGTDRGLELIRRLTSGLSERGVEFRFEEEALEIDAERAVLRTNRSEYPYGRLVVAPGRGGFGFLKKLMDDLGVSYIDHIVDIGVRVETRMDYYPIVRDYYDPKFHFPDKVRTFCTNSRRAYVVKEKYQTREGRTYFSVNGHAFSERRRENGLVNFAMLKTVRFTEPLASGQDFAVMLGLQAMLMGGGQPIMQRVGDFRLGRRSKREDFNHDLYDFPPSLASCTPGDISLAMPAKILRGIWKSMKLLDTIVPGVLHPSTILYYPEIKLYANKPAFLDRYFRVKDGIYMVGDGAGTSRGITAAWASGMRAAEGIAADGG